MRVEITKSRQCLGYFAGDKPDLPEETAKELIDSGYAKSCDEKMESDLPKELPGRAALIKAGLFTKDQVLASKESLVDIKGIGEKLAGEIIEFLTA